MSVDGVLRIADADGLHVALQPGRGTVLVDVALHIDARGSGAVLAGVDEPARDGAARRGIEVGVRVDDEGRLAAELQVDALEVARGQLLDLPARRRVAGERHQVDVIVTGDRRTHLVAGTGDHVEHARRKAGFERQRAELDAWSAASRSPASARPSCRLPVPAPIFQMAIMKG